MADNTKLKAPATTPGHWFIDPATGNTIRTAKRGCIGIVCSAPPFAADDILVMRAAPQLLAALLEAERLLAREHANIVRDNADPDGTVRDYTAQCWINDYAAAMRHAREALLQAGCRS